MATHKPAPENQSANSRSMGWPIAFAAILMAGGYGAWLNAPSTPQQTPAGLAADDSRPADTIDHLHITSCHRSRDGTPRCGLGCYQLAPWGSVGRHWYAVVCVCVARRPFS